MEKRNGFEPVSAAELHRVDGGVMPVYDEKGNIIRTCTDLRIDSSKWFQPRFFPVRG